MKTTFAIVLTIVMLVPVVYILMQCIHDEVKRVKREGFWGK